MNLERRLIGLTGGIATGKSTVSNYLARQYHLPILDADIYAREAVAVGSPILTAIFQRYGDRVQQPDLSLDRSSLGEIIFNDPYEKQWLENQIHPYVRDRFEQELKRTDSNTIILDIPLLFEARLTDTVTEIWVVSCDRSWQISRLQQRNSLTLEQAQARIANQFPLAQKAAAADVVLDNNGSVGDLYFQIDAAIAVSKS